MRLRAVSSSYDYTDFVDGLRPTAQYDNVQNVSGYERKNGVFKQFCEKAAKNVINSKKSEEKFFEELAIEEKLNGFLNAAIDNKTQMETVNKTQFEITAADNSFIDISIPENAVTNKLHLKKNEILQLLQSGKQFHGVKEITSFFNLRNGQQSFSYYYIILNEVAKIKAKKSNKPQIEALKPFIFIIDEINRGKTSKILAIFFLSTPAIVELRAN